MKKLTLPAVLIVLSLIFVSCGDDTSSPEYRSNAVELDYTVKLVDAFTQSDAVDRKSNCVIKNVYGEPIRVKLKVVVDKLTSGHVIRTTFAGENSGDIFNEYEFPVMLNLAAGETCSDTDFNAWIMPGVNSGSTIARFVFSAYDASGNLIEGSEISYSCTFNIRKSGDNNGGSDTEKLQIVNPIRAVSGSLSAGTVDLKTRAGLKNNTDQTMKVSLTVSVSGSLYSGSYSFQYSGESKIINGGTYTFGNTLTLAPYQRLSNAVSCYLDNVTTPGSSQVVFTFTPLNVNGAKQESYTCNFNIQN